MASTSTPAATPTPAPTATAAPTFTPVPTATPAFSRWKSSQVVDAFKAAGLEVIQPTLMTVKDYGLSPMAADEGIHFIIPSLCVDCGGRIFSFSTPEDLALMQSYYVSLSKKVSAALFSWVFVKDNILVQINGDLPEAQANKYQAALNSLK